MKIKTTNRKKRRNLIIIVIIVCLFLLATGGVSTYKLLHQNKPVNTTPVRVKSDIQQAKKIEQDPSVKQTSPNTDTPTQPTTNATTGKAVAEMVASSNISDGTLYLRGGINNLVVSDGTCYFSLNGPNGESVTENTSLLQNPTSTDCKTVSIDTNTLSKGQWSFTLNYSSDTASGASDENTFTIQ